MNNVTTILGAPGCGKTTYLLNLLEDILKEYDPTQVAFVSFTRKGSYEGRDRAIGKFNFKESDLPYFRTIHSIAFRELGMSRYDMISKRHYKEFSKAMGMNFVGYYTEDFVNNDDKYLFMVSLAKNNPNAAEYLRKTMEVRSDIYKNVERSYERFKKESGVYDFDDLLWRCTHENPVTLPVKVAIIDEAQDLTKLQWDFCALAFKECDKVYVAGDDDQAIYEWNGADLNKFLRTAQESERIVLDKSFRLKSNVLNLAKKISSSILHRVEKNFNPVSVGGTVQFHNDIEEIPINNMESYYFLSRNNYFLPRIKEHLMKLGVVFTHKNGSSVDNSKYNAIKRYETLRREGRLDHIRKDTILQTFLKKDYRRDSPWFEAFDLRVEECSYYRDLFKNKTDITKSNIHVSTIHGVKGGEADNVVLKLDMTRNVYKNLRDSMANLDSEMRCLYVALTRAKNNLHIVYSITKFGYDEFIKEEG